MKYLLPKAVFRSNLAVAYAYSARLSDSQVNRYDELLLAPGNRGAMRDRMRQTLLQCTVGNFCRTPTRAA